MIRCYLILVLIVIVTGCKKNYDIAVPDTNWTLFNDPATRPLNQNTHNKLQGVYTVEEGNAAFGNTIAAKWSYTVNGQDTTYHFSMFCSRDVVYIICEGKRFDSSILLNGYWRNMINTETGHARLTIKDVDGGRALLDTSSTTVTNITITGTYNYGTDAGTSNLRFKYQKPLNQADNFEIVAHRGGGRTADFLPASENSVEVIKLASRFGATGIEIDVKMTKDGVPILYHDETLNERLIQKNGMIGPIENYTYQQLYSLVRLKNGERIPTLREALEAVVKSTPLRYVWLDTKFIGPIDKVRAMQTEFMQLAASSGRQLVITIGIPDEEVLQNFKKLPNFQSIPSVCELTLQDVQSVNAQIWAPRFTLGLQNTEVQNMHNQNRKVFVWTLDVPENIHTYMTEGDFDGILSNYPSAVAYFHYANQ